MEATPAMAGLRGKASETVETVKALSNETVETVKAIFKSKDDSPASSAQKWRPSVVGEALRQYAMEMLRDSLGADALVGTAGIIVANVALKSLVWLFEVCGTFIVSRTTVTATFESGDSAHEWILNWLAMHPYTKTATEVVVSSRLKRGETLQQGSSGTVIDFTPAPGTHFIRVGCKIGMLTRERKKNEIGKDKVEKISITLLGRSREPIDLLVRDALEKQMARDKHLTVIFTGDQYGTWQRSRVRPIRPLSSVILQGSLEEELSADIREFFESEAWYLDRGIPFRRGYLLYGPPGNGKTSLVAALAGFMGINIHVLSLANPSLSDENVMDLLNETPQRCVLLLEDIDHAFARMSDADGGEGSTVLASSKVTFAGLLNALDGVAAQEGRLLILTTNHAERLSPVLLRPGRVDVRVHIGNASESQMRRMFLRFYGAHTDVDASTLATNFVAGLPGASEAGARLIFGEHSDGKPTTLFKCGDDSVKGISMARLQGHFMKYKRDPVAAVANKFELLGISPLPPQASAQE